MKRFERNTKGKVKQNSRNISKMNIFEIAYYGTFEWGYISNLLDMLKNKDLLEELLEFFFALLMLLTYPISIFITAFIIARKSKRETKNENNQ